VREAQVHAPGGGHQPLVGSNQPLPAVTNPVTNQRVPVVNMSTLSQAMQVT